MEIIAIYINEAGVALAFVAPAYGGDNIHSLTIPQLDNDIIDNHKSIIFDSFSDAHKKAYLTVMSEIDYNQLYNELKT